jgi:hypothetical protein
MPCEKCPNDEANVKHQDVSPDALVRFRKTGAISCGYMGSDQSPHGAEFEAEDVQERFPDVQTRMEQCEYPFEIRYRIPGWLGKLGIKRTSRMCRAFDFNPRSGVSVERYFGLDRIGGKGSEA